MNNGIDHDGCTGCKYENQDEHLEPCFHCEGTKQGDKYSRMTNADRIRSMSDEELVKFIVGLNDHCLAGIGLCDCSGAKHCSDSLCENKTRKWLQAEVKESE